MSKKGSKSGSVLVLAAALAAFAPAARADFVRNGDGLAEKNVVYAYYALERILALCEASASCKLTGAEQGLAEEILSALPEERANSQQLVFKSAAQAPGTFLIGGEQKIAVTGDAVGSEIDVNVDLLYANTASGPMAVFSVAEAIGVLVHEFGHHHGMKDEAALDAMGAKVELFAVAHEQKIELSRSQPQIVIDAFDYRQAGRTTEVLISDGNSIFDLGPLLLTTLRCRAGQLSGAYLFNFHWDMYQKVPGTDLSSLDLAALADVQLFCDDDQAKVSRSEGYFRARIAIPAKKDGGGLYRMREGEDVRLEILDCKKDVAACEKG